VKIVIWVSVAVVIVLALVVGSIAMLGAKFDPSKVKGAPVRLLAAERGRLVEAVTAPGEVAPRTRVAISARVSARIVALPCIEGAVVTAGDPDAEPPQPASVLVRLDATDLEAALRGVKARRAAQAAQSQVELDRIASQRARIDQVVASLTLARRELGRQQKLFDSADVSQSAVDQSLSRVDELTAELESAKHTLAASESTLIVLQYNLEGIDAEIARAQDSLDHTVIVSPIDGVVTRINAEVGELAVTGTMNNPGTVILEVADLSNMVVRAQVDEADVGGVEVGQPVRVLIHAYADRMFDGTVNSIALTAEAGASKFFKTEVLLETDGERIYSGLNADVAIAVAQHEDVLLLPSQAILGRSIDDLPAEVRRGNTNIDQSKTIATVVYRCIDGKAVLTPVTIGASDETHTIIEGGLSAGERVIVGPYKVLETIKHNDKVTDEEAAPDKTDKADAPETNP
jgi:HlyD family secretion protein